jgi:hypothetical protein
VQIAAARIFMAEDRNDDSGFKVVDRRSFATDGTRRPDVTEDEERSAKAPSSTTEASRQPPMQPKEDLGEDERGFETLVSYLSTTAMFQLGALPGPSGERIPADMPNARRTIDLLEVLQQKTRGNLTPAESGLLEEVLYELRMTFLEMEKRQARKQR